MPSYYDKEQGKWITLRKGQKPPTKALPPDDAGSYRDESGTWHTIRRRRPAPTTPTETQGHGKRGIWYWNDLKRKPKQETEPEE